MLTAVASTNTVVNPVSGLMATGSMTLVCGVTPLIQAGGYSAAAVGVASGVTLVLTAIVSRSCAAIGLCANTGPVVASTGSALSDSPAELIGSDAT